MYKPNSVFFEKINEIDRLLARPLKKKKRPKLLRDTTTKLKEIKSIIREQCEPLHAKKLDNKDEMKKKNPRKTQTTKIDLKRNRLSEQTYSKWSKLLILFFFTRKISGLDDFAVEFTRCLKRI